MCVKVERGGRVIRLDRVLLVVIEWIEEEWMNE